MMKTEQLTLAATLVRGISVIQAIVDYTTMMISMQTRCAVLVEEALVHVRI